MHTGVPLHSRERYHLSNKTPQRRYQYIGIVGLQSKIAREKYSLRLINDRQYLALQEPLLLATNLPQFLSFLQRLRRLCWNWRNLRLQSLFNPFTWRLEFRVIRCDIIGCTVVLISGRSPCLVNTDYSQDHSPPAIENRRPSVTRRCT